MGALRRIGLRFGSNDKIKPHGFGAKVEIEAGDEKQIQKSAADLLSFTEFSEAHFV